MGLYAPVYASIYTTPSFREAGVFAPTPCDKRLARWSGPTGGEATPPAVPTRLKARCPSTSRSCVGSGRLFPLLARQFKLACGGDGVSVHDAFVVRYEEGKQRYLPLHRDQSTHSLTVS